MPDAKIDSKGKTILVAAQPPINNDPSDLEPAFWTKLDAALTALANAGTPFKLVEGFRTVERQQWLYGSGRPSAKPYGRSGPIVTHRDGVRQRSNHQGDGTAGSGRAADCYPLRDGKVYIPKATDPIWKTYADALRAGGLTAGYYWPKFKDAPHAELEDGTPAVAPNSRTSIPQAQGAWTPPVLGDDEEISISQDPRVNSTHKAGVLPCPKNPPPPTGWKYWRAKVPEAGTALAVSVRDDQGTYPMGSFVQTRLQGKLIAARVEWHTEQARSGKKGCFRGVNLMAPV